MFFFCVFKCEAPRFTSARTGFFYFKLPEAIARFWGSLPTRSVVQGSGSYSLKEDVLIRVRLSYFADPMFYNYVKFFMFYIAKGDGKVPGHPSNTKC